MRNLVIKEINRLMKFTEIDYDIRPWNEWSNKELLQFYGDLRIDIETEEIGRHGLSHPVLKRKKK